MAISYSQVKEFKINFEGKIDHWNERTSYSCSSSQFMCFEEWLAVSLRFSEPTGETEEKEEETRKNYGNFILIACADSHQSESSWLYKYLISVCMRLLRLW